MTTGKDRRAMNRMDPATKLVHMRLEVWGTWAKGNPELRQFAAESVLYRIAHQGVTAAAQGRIPTAEIPEPIQITELAVVQLDLHERNAVCAYYLNWAPVVMLARRLGIGENVFADRLTAGRRHVGVYVKGFTDALGVSQSIIAGALNT